MRRLLALVLLFGGPLLWLRRRREARRGGVRLYYADGSMTTLEPGVPLADRLLALARTAL